MRLRTASLGVLLAPLVLGAASSTSPAVARHEGGRNVVPYDDPHSRAKAALLARINQDRRGAGLLPVAYSTRAARAGDRFCRDSVEQDFHGHWDLDGRSPYLRWSLAGGIDAHAENFASKTRSPGPLMEPLEEILLEAHAAFMAERPPADGHRRTILDPRWTHVGIGAALSGGRFRMTEEFVDQVMAWVELPSGPVPAGKEADFAAKLPPGWNLLAVGIAWEPPPLPISRAEAGRRGSYTLPEPSKMLRPYAPRGGMWSDGSRGDFAAPPTGGLFRLKLLLDRRPGSTWVMVYAGPGEVTGKPISAMTLARIEGTGSVSGLGNLGIR